MGPVPGVRAHRGLHVLARRGLRRPRPPSVRPVLDGLGSDALRSQLTVPIALTKLLPVGLMGAFAAVMLAAAIGCNETYLHSWGSIFIQDVVHAPAEEALRAGASTSRLLQALDPGRRRLHLRLQPALPAERVHLPLLRHHRGHLRRRQRRGHHRRPVLEARHDGRGLVGHDRRRGRRRRRHRRPADRARLPRSTARCSGAWPWPPSSVVYVVVSLLTAAAGRPSTWTRCSTGASTWSERNTPSSMRSRSRAGRSWAWAGSSPAGTRSSTSRPTPGRPAGSSSSSSGRSST
ncbi:MAG: hypothetical protein MZU95_01400 [Desulfomicrobium escambiense]|nr:hypothetical protein [Desulfomicrobium escambiense]